MDAVDEVRIVAVDSRVARRSHLELSSRGWRGGVITPNTVAEIERIRRPHTPTKTLTPRR
jgi:hypothetical protein